MLFHSAYQLQTFLLDVFDYFYNAWTQDEGKLDKEQNGESKMWERKSQEKKSEILNLKYYWF